MTKITLLIYASLIFLMLMFILWILSRHIPKMKTLLFSLLVALVLVWTCLILCSFVWKQGFYEFCERINSMTRTSTRICVSIILFVVIFVLWVLARLTARIRTLFIASFAAFIVVLTCLIHWWFGGKPLLLDKLILIPGFAAARLIAAQVDKIDKIAYLSNFEGPFFTIVMFFSSFVFYTAVIFAAIKAVSYLKKRPLLRKANESKVTESFEER